jgi:PRTRC genetic system protein A
MEIISQHISCVVLPNELQTAIEAGYSEIYAMTSEGIVKHHKLRGRNRFVRLKVDKLPANYKEEKVSQEINFLPDGKIPIQLFDQVVAFFKQVMEVKKSELEAMIWVCWDQESGYHLIVPEQRVSKASASYDWASLPAGKTIVCDIHSHNTMGAFFSGTDNRDDQGNIGFSGVVGRLKDETPQTVWRFNYKDKKIECEFDDIFVLPVREEQAIPEDWISKIVTTSTGYSTGGNNQKGKADHLKPWQYKRGENTSEGNRAGPHMLAHDRGLLPDGYGNYWEERFGSEAANLSGGGGFPWESWAFNPDDVDADGIIDPSKLTLDKAERALAVLREDPGYEDSHLDYSPRVHPYNPDFDPDVNTTFDCDERYEEVKEEHGKDVADIFCLIDDGMSVLNGKDDLVRNLMSDMIHMMSEEGQEELFRDLYQELPDKAQERIQMNGIH